MNIFSTSEKELKFKDKYVDSLKESSNQAEGSSISVMNLKTTTEN